jgi:hypothetical protein
VGQASICQPLHCFVGNGSRGETGCEEVIPWIDSLNRLHLIVGLAKLIANLFM